MIQWTEVTWYSRIAAIIVFVGVMPVLNFFIGIQYQQTTAALEKSVEAQNPLPVCPIPDERSDHADSNANDSSPKAPL